jgi:hypothetical protein
MIHYQLRCTSTDAEHAFDGWYRDSVAFDTLAAAGLVECPVCGGTTVARALMAPAIPKKGRPARNAAVPAPAPSAPPAAPSPPAGAPAVAAGPMPDQVRAMLQKLRAEIERNCDYVGQDFAEEARRMQRGQSERRGIFGEASDADAEALHDEGIEVARIPWVPRADG